MREDGSLPQINMSKIVVGGGLAGAFVAVGSMSIFLVGVPLIRYLFPVAILFGSGIALISTSGAMKLPARRGFFQSARNRFCPLHRLGDIKARSRLK
jgi:hypothetical protein